MKVNGCCTIRIDQYKQIRMGNRQHGRGQDDFQRMITAMRQDQSRRVNVNPQKKYLSHMKDALMAAKLPESLKKIILQTLEDKVSEVELIETVTCINALKNNEFEVNNNRSQISTKERPESKYVNVNFGDGFLKKILRKLAIGDNIIKNQQLDQTPPISPMSRMGRTGPTNRKRYSKDSEEDRQLQQKQKLHILTQVMRKQLNRIIHPFGKLNKAFAEYVQGYSEEFAPKNCKEQLFEKNARRLIVDWCQYLQTAVLSPYKKWIMSYTELEEVKYSQWLRHLLIQEIWTVNNGYLFSMLATVIQRCKVPPALDYKQLQQSAALLTPSLFCIDQKLQIEGHFFDSIYQMSQVASHQKPQKILAQLQTVKKRVCTDIDNYHRLVEAREVFQIDSDNILGIVGYILCKIASKIDQIHTHLVFLRIIYGDKVYYSMGLGSYMLSTVFGALQFLQSEHFKQLIQQKKTKNPRISKTLPIIQKPGQSQTKVTTTAPGEGVGMQEDVSQAELHTQSLLEHL